MKGGRTAPRNWCYLLMLSRRVFSASMKGGRTAPRNTSLYSLATAACLCFNEGGADCPPKRQRRL